MRKIIAIAFLEVRAAIRSRLFISLITVLLATIIGLPIIIKGDGTLTGQVKILLCYTLGLTAVILGIATLWTSCGAISREIEDKQIHLVAAKPVHRFQVWLGKWLGLLVMNAALLCLAGAATCAVLHWNIRPARSARPSVAGGPSPTAGEDRHVLYEEILVGRRQIHPRKESVEKEAREQLNRLRKEGKLPNDESAENALSLIRKRLLVQKSVVAPGRSKQWIFDIPARRKDDASILLRFRFSSSARDMAPVTGTWNLGPARSATPNVAGGTEDKPDLFKLTTKNYLDGVHRFSIPASAVPPGRHLVVEYRNNERDRSQTVMFDSERGVELLIRESGFEMNLVRALLIILCHLALFAALGLTAGTLFSFPVATFVASALLVVSMTAHYFTFTSSPGHSCGHNHHHGPGAKPSIFRTAGEKTIEHLNVIIEPSMRLDPLGPLSDGLLVSWRLVGRAVLLLAVVYPGVLGLIGGYFFKRKELALP